MPRLANIRKKEPFDVFIGRPSKWGNPFIEGKDGTRDQIIYKYALWLLDQRPLLDALNELRGKVLGCFCCPKSCHGDILSYLTHRYPINAELVEYFKVHYKRQLEWTGGTVEEETAEPEETPRAVETPPAVSTPASLYYDYLTVPVQQQQTVWLRPLAWGRPSYAVNTQPCVREPRNSQLLDWA